MTKETNSRRSTRRSFLQRGALLAVPLAATAPAAVIAEDGLKARLARLEDEAAIRELHQAWMRRVNTSAGAGGGDGVAPLFAGAENTALNQGVRGIAADHAGKPDAIEVAADGKCATGRFQCSVEIENAIAQDCTVAQMAHAQGGGFVRRTERRELAIEYLKAGGAWTIAKAAFASV
jgi:hypothetical protein